MREYTKEDFITDCIVDICKDILKNKMSTGYQDIYAMLFEHIEDKIELFLPEPYIE